jgi:secreted trypsin-like serine protease
MALDVTQPLIVYGFGLDESGGPADTLRSVELRRVPRIRCEKKWSDLQVHNDLCAIGACRGAVCADTCSGDSGGGMVRQDTDGVLRLYGVVSRGHPTCQTDHPGIYTDLSDHISWMADPRTHIPPPRRSGAERPRQTVGASIMAILAFVSTW